MMPLLFVFLIIIVIKSLTLDGALEVEQIPERFSYMIKEVAVKRYNRIGAEGMTSEAVDGRSNAYEMNDFKEYEAIIDNYFNARTRTKKGKAVFF
ncbi:phage head-tail connector protein [Staphylococcus aureus]|uniref:phage head-tail connector protein n=1 Tax=Staphylococcus aureus TaxID=1280 RepID=UPI0021095139|nr:phage head-tail connector protein [Staphylococcus aureus]